MWVWLSGSLFVGWSLGANDAANVFGPAVASRMVTFSTVAKLCAIFVILGGLINGPAAIETVGGLGRIETLPGAFWSALSASLAVAIMTWARMPISTSQAVVGALVGYQLSHYGSIDTSTIRLLYTFLLAWLASPIFAAMIAYSISRLVAFTCRRVPTPVLILDRWLRLALVFVGCYGSWSLGGNNMANVVGFYGGLDLFDPLEVGPWWLHQSQILALLGGIAISSGVFSFSRRVMYTVGRDLVRLNAVTAFIAILAEALVLHFFSRSWNFGFFYLPAIPVSATQALVGAVVGVGLARGIQVISTRVLVHIMLSWIITPVIAGIFAYRLSLIA